MYLLPDLVYPLLHVMSTYASPMGTHANPPSLDLVRAASSSGIHTKLTIDGCGDVNNMKIADPPDCSVPSAGLVHTPKTTDSIFAGGCCNADRGKVYETESCLF